MTELEELEVQLAKKYVRLKTLNQNVRELEDKMSKIKAEKLKPKYKGKTFKFRNSYGYDSDSWWLYTKVINVVEHYARGVILETCQFEKTSKDIIEFKFSNMHIEPEQQWIEIPNEEYEEALNMIKEDVNCWGEEK